MKNFYFLFTILLLSTFSFGQTFFQTTSPDSKEFTEKLIQAENAEYFTVDIQGLRSSLQNIPYRESLDINLSNFLVQLPNKMGGFNTYKVVRNKTMHPDLNALFPDILTFDGINVNDPQETIKLDLTYQGFHAMIYSPDHSTIFIDPVNLETTNKVMVYYKKDFISTKSMHCDLESEAEKFEKIIGGGNIPTKQYGTCQLRTYRLALAATGEYTTFHGGTVAGAASAQVTTMNRVNGVYEREMAITMVIVPGNNGLIFTNSLTDPYTNGTPGTMINENVTQCNAVIGSANYDIGHVFGTNSGGLAGLGVVCGTSKARGVTGSSAPVGDPFDIDYVAHEIGHQFSANHTQNNSCNRNNATAAETGSGITIMGYAGICAPNVGNNSIDHFHAVSLSEISNFITGGGHTCPVITNISNAAPLITSTTGNISIPISTPFSLTCVATDANNDPLTYNWEQTDVQVSTQAPVSTSTSGPSFRSYSSSSNPRRYMPNLVDLSANGPFTWESLPSVARTMNFRVSVRDNRPGGSCSDFENLTVTTIATAGPFVVSYPSATGISLTGGIGHTVTWAVANTTAAPISAATANIYLSTDGGLTYPTLLLSGTANDGSQTVTLPNINTSTARIMVTNGAQTFFDISDNNFSIVQTLFGYSINASPTPQNICQGTNAVFAVSTASIGGYAVPINLSASGLPAGASANFVPSTVNPGQSSVLTISNASVGTHLISINGSSGAINNSTSVTLNVTSSSLGAITIVSPVSGSTGTTSPVNLSWSSISGATYSVDISTSPTFSSFVSQASGLTTNSYTTGVLSNSTTYYWRVNATNGCATTAYAQANFTTGACFTFNATNVPVTISASGTVTVTSTLNVTQSGTITGISIPNITGTHTWVSDLTINLISPNNTSVTLFSNICGNNVNFNLGFDDASGSATITCPLTSGNIFQPLGTLNNILGENAAGVWTLQIIDGFNFDGGSLTAWSLALCVSNSCSTPTVPIVSGSYSEPNTIADGVNVIYATTCDLIGEIQDTPGGNVLGNTTMSSTLLSSIPAPNGDGYLRGRRSYTISPNSDGEALVKLYFTQADFDNYNANNNGFLDLPTSGSNSDPNIQYFRLYTTTSGGYTISPPYVSSLNWNGSVWEFTTTLQSVNATFDFATQPSCVGINVANLQASNVTASSVFMSWSSVITSPSAGWYGFRYRVVGSSTWINGGTANNPATTKTINGLSAGTNYEIQIQRHCSSQSEGPWSSSVFFTTPASGCGFSIALNSSPTSTSNSITVTWPSIVGVGWYEFRYKLSSSSTWVSGGTSTGTATSKTISGLVAGTSYDVQIRSFCPNGSPSPWSTSVTATTLNLACSLPPSISASNITSTSVTIAWPAVSGATWYAFRYKPTSSSTWTNGGTASGSTTTKSYTGLTANTAYNFEAQTYCSSGTPSSWGAIVFTTTSAGGCNLPPVLNPTAITTVNSIQISWGSVVGAGWYSFEYKESSSSTWLPGGTAGGLSTSKLYTGLNLATAYDFRGRTYCANGLPSAWGTAVTYSTSGAAGLIANTDKPSILITKTALSDNSEVLAYPNPTKGKIYIDFTLGENPTSTLVFLLDNSGRRVKEIQVDGLSGSNTVSMDLPEMKEGVYFVVIETEGKQAGFVRIIKI